AIISVLFSLIGGFWNRVNPICIKEVTPLFPKSRSPEILCSESLAHARIKLVSELKVELILSDSFVCYLLLTMDDEQVPRGLTLEQAHDLRRDRAIENLQRQMERVLNLLENLERQEQPARRPDDQRHHDESDSHHNSNDDSDSAGGNSSALEHRVRRRRRRYHENDREIKADAPEFDGSLNPDNFVDWLLAIERVFDFKSYSDEKRCKVAVLKLTKYASLWWENLKRQRAREKKSRIKSWDKLKKLMKKRFLPDTYK
ncbi:unnamed protein product, partial [Musa textilis]